MKKAEAISILATSVRPREPKDRARYDEAVRMAIEALKCSETPKSSEQNAETTQADHIADTGRKVEQAAEIAQNVQNDDLISRKTAIDALNEYFARIGKLKRRGLTKGEKAISLDTVGTIKNLPPAEAIPVSWIEAKIELVNDLPGVSMLKMKVADWSDLVKQWRAEQRNPEVDHDAKIGELVEEMQKHGVT